MFICALSALIVQIEEQLTKRRLERDERRRAQKEEHKKLERLEKLMAAFKKKQRSEAEKVKDILLRQGAPLRSTVIRVGRVDAIE